MHLQQNITATNKLPTNENLRYGWPVGEFLYAFTKMGCLVASNNNEL